MDINDMYNGLAVANTNTRSFASMLVDLDTVHETKTSICNASVALRRKLLDTRKILREVSLAVSNLKHLKVAELDKEIRDALRAANQAKIDTHNEEKAQRILDLKEELKELEG